MKSHNLLIFFVLVLAACKPEDNEPDAYGNFEATEVTVSSEAMGKLISFDVEEGKTYGENQLVGVIDTTQLVLKKQQLLASRAAVASRTKNIVAQINTLQEQKRIAEREFQRLKSLEKGGAATPKQIDDMQGSIDVLQRQIASVQSQNAPILGELEAFDAQIAQIDDQIDKSKIITPLKGTVLSKLAEPSEFVTVGKSLFSIANLDEIDLRVYVSGAQMPSIKIGDKVTVMVDRDADEKRNLEGVITWISSKSEFTPKIVQTREERVNLVYAIKVRVKNDGLLKIGMPGEVKFITTVENEN